MPGVSLLTQVLPAAYRRLLPARKRDEFQQRQCADPLILRHAPKRHAQIKDICCLANCKTETNLEIPGEKALLVRWREKI